MRKQEITRAIDLIAHHYATAMWYEKQTDIENRFEKAKRERSGAEAIEWLLMECHINKVVHRDKDGREYAVSAYMDKESVYIRWVAAAVHPWDEISFEMFKEEVEETKELYKVYTTDGCRGMKEI